MREDCEKMREDCEKIAKRLQEDCEKPREAPEEFSPVVFNDVKSKEIHAFKK